MAPTDDMTPQHFTLNAGPEDDAADDGESAPIRSRQSSHRDQRAQTSEGRGARRLAEALISRVPRAQAKRLVTETYGTGPRGGPNVTAAAADLGVHPSTVRRWIHNKQVPERSAAGARLRRTWESSRAGRRASISPARRRAFADATSRDVFQGALTGHIWVTSEDPRNGQERSFNFTLDGATAKQIHEAILDGDDDRAHELLEDGLQGFGDGGVDIDVTDFSWRGLP